MVHWPWPSPVPTWPSTRTYAPGSSSPTRPGSTVRRPDDRRGTRAVQRWPGLLQLAHGGTDDRARDFATGLADRGTLDTVAAVTVDLLGSLGTTGRGHATNRAVMLGLCGHDPAALDPADATVCSVATAASRAPSPPSPPTRKALLTRPARGRTQRPSPRVGSLCPWPSPCCCRTWHSAPMSGSHNSSDWPSSLPLSWPRSR
ncbi:serine dehydratase beta chain [Streptomyces sp. NPDC048644]|uniref:serine dehydratase beta chain n=1 Tax=Streptomyces sp. NPDC048644 TaxID=3365582 RepID=UPI00371EA70F